MKELQRESKGKMEKMKEHKGKQKEKVKENKEK